MSSIGVIGAGRWGKNIIRTLHDVGSLGGICELDQSLRAEISKQYPEVEIFTTTKALYDADIIGVAIATPVVTHYEVAKQALAAGHDVFIEKPITVTTKEADELVDYAKQQDKILMVGHMLLYQPAIQFIKEFLEAGRLGRIYSLRQIRRNLGTVRTQENAVYSLGVHDLAVLSYLIGNDKVKKITSAGQSVITPGIQGDVSIHLEYESGICAHLHVCWLWPTKERNLIILGEKGALLYNELTHTVTYYKNYVNQDASLTKGGEEVVFEGSGQPLLLEMQHFVNCLEKRAVPISPGTQGVEVVRIIEQINQQLNM
jgi:predicted dehydrogenase